MKILIFGLGYVGTTVSACLARQGHNVVGIDAMAEKVATINSGLSPIAEPGLNELIAEGLSKGLLMATQDPAPHIVSASMAIVCVGTPSSLDGSHNMTYIANVTREIASMIDGEREEPLTVVYRSTMHPGALEELVTPIFEAKLGSGSSAVELAYSPEFLRESYAIQDYFNPPKVVVGTRDGKPCRNLDEINADMKAPVFYTKFREAEMTKFVDNTFHALKVAFGNEIGRICSKLGVDSETVYRIFVSDTKLNISAHYLRPGSAFGGSCLPKDVRALQRMSAETGAMTYVVDSLLRSNDAHKQFLFDACTKGLQQSANVLMLGLSFKAGSDDLRESPNVDLARKFLNGGYKLSVCDPELIPSKLVGQNLGYAYSALPMLSKLIVTKEEVESCEYGLILDLHGSASRYALRGKRIVDVHALLEAGR